METILTSVLHAALVLHIVMIAVSAWRVWRGENPVDRLIGADLIGTLMLAILILVAVIELDSIYIDVALALAVLGSVGTIALAKYMADQQMF